MGSFSHLGAARRVLHRSHRVSSFEVLVQGQTLVSAPWPKSCTASAMVWPCPTSSNAIGCGWPTWRCPPWRHVGPMTGVFRSQLSSAGFWMILAHLTPEFCWRSLASSSQVSAWWMLWCASPGAMPLPGPLLSLYHCLGPSQLGTAEVNIMLPIMIENMGDA